MFKRGLSSVIATVLLILLALGAIIFAYAGINVFLESSQDEISQREGERIAAVEGNFELREANIVGESRQSFDLLFRNVGSLEVVNLKINIIKGNGEIISFDGNERLVFPENIFVSPLETARFTFNVGDDLSVGEQLTAGWIVEVVPVFLIEEREIINADVKREIMLEGGEQNQNECSDGEDNDNDDASDENDYSCQIGGTYENSFFAQCQDGLDNDNDELIDYGTTPTNDPGCSDSQDNDERNGQIQINLDVLNNGNPIDAGDGMFFRHVNEKSFASLIDGEGNLIYFYKSKMNGEQEWSNHGHTSLGRFNAAFGEKKWEINSFSNWDGSQNAMPMPVNYGAMAFSYLHPFFVNGNLNLVANEYLRFGEEALNVHGDTGMFRLQGNEWEMWDGQNVFSSSSLAPIFYDRSASQFSFDLADESTGILVSVYNEDSSQIDKLVAAKYTQGNSIWQRWNNTGWIDYTGGTNVDCDQLGRCDPVLPDTVWNQDLYYPNILYIGNNKYLVTFLDETTTSAFLYDDAEVSWKWWDGNSFEQDGNYIFGEFIPLPNPNDGSEYDFYSMQLLQDGRVAIIYNQTLRISIFDSNWAKTDIIIDSPNTGISAVSQVDSSGNLWLAYSIGDEIKLKKFVNDNNNFEEVDVYDDVANDDNVRVVGINFVSGNVPVVFYEMEERLYAVSDSSADYWLGEIFATRNAPEQNVPETNIVSFLSSWDETGGAEYGSQTGANLGLDAQGYLYSPHKKVNRVEIYSPNYDENNPISSRWQGWGYMHFPSAVDIHNGEGVSKIYVSDYLAGSGSGVIRNGRIRVWDLDERTSQSPVPVQGDSNLVVFLFPSDIAVDEANDYLYVTETFGDVVRRYSLNADGTININDNNIILQGGDVDMPRGVDVDSAGDVYVIDSGNHAIRKLNSDGDAVLDFGSLGRDRGEFILPESISVNDDYVFVTDPYNKKILIFNKYNGNFVDEFGAVDMNGDGNEDVEFSILGGIVADDSNLYVAANKKIYKFDIDQPVFGFLP